MTRPAAPAPDVVGWNGQIDVDPDELEAAAPGFLGASDEVVAAADWVSRCVGGSTVGISDPATAAAWSRAMGVWGRDLGNLVTTLAQVASLLGKSAQGYRQADVEAATPYGS
jgi:hypothetical protein